jgi:hypothetical protein
MKIGDTLLDPIEGWKGTIVKFVHEKGFDLPDSNLAAIAVVECDTDGKLDWMAKGLRLLVDVRNCKFEDEAGDFRRKVVGRDA